MARRNLRAQKVKLLVWKKKNFTLWAVKVWNELPEEVVRTPSVNSFGQILVIIGPFVQLQSKFWMFCEFISLWFDFCFSFSNSCLLVSLMHLGDLDALTENFNKCSINNVFISQFLKKSVMDVFMSCHSRGRRPQPRRRVGASCRPAKETKGRCGGEVRQLCTVRQVWSFFDVIWIKYNSCPEHHIPFIKLNIKRLFDLTGKASVYRWMMTSAGEDIMILFTHCLLR